MARAIVRINNLTRGFVMLGRRGQGRGTPKQQTSDGDTISVETDGNFSIRFLGIDSPEKRFPLPDNANRFIRLDDLLWMDYLCGPFSAEANSQFGEFEPEIECGLREYLQGKLDSTSGQNHYEHALVAEDALEEFIISDMDELNQDEDEFGFFLAFAHEIMDGYGRLLAYVNRNQPSSVNRPKSLNERLLVSGKVLPYFIWPNVDPFRGRSGGLVNAVPPAGEAKVWAEDSRSLSEARDSVRAARCRTLGVFREDNPLQLESFEVRYLGRRNPPSRWLVDLTSESEKLIAPQDYYTVEHPEDRLFIPTEYIPLWVESGWKRS